MLRLVVIAKALVYCLALLLVLRQTRLWSSHHQCILDHITAGHCSDGAGSSILDEGDSVVAASKVIILENCTSNFVNDIAAIQMSTAFPLGESVQIVLLVSSTPVTGVEVTITGWGHTKDFGNNSHRLQVVKVPVVGHAVCKTEYISYCVVTEHMLCAGLPQGGKDSCRNDSGGPAVVNGTVSWGYSCAVRNHAGVYTDVASVRSWVIEHSGV